MANDYHYLKYKFELKWEIGNIHALPCGTSEKTAEFIIEPRSKWYVELEIDDKGAYRFHFYRNATSFCKLWYQCYVSDSTSASTFMSFHSPLKGIEFLPGNCKNEILTGIDIPFHIEKVRLVENLMLTFSIQVLHFRPKMVTAMEFSPSLMSDSYSLGSYFQSRPSKKPNYNPRNKLTLKVQGEYLTVDRNALCGRSPVWTKLLQSLGNAECVIGIEEITRATMRLFLEYVYSGKLLEYDLESALQLYYVACKYEVEALKEHCKKILVSKVGDYVGYVVWLAITQGDRDLINEIRHTVFAKLQ